MQRGSLVKGLPSAAGKRRLIYIFQRYRLSSAACLPVGLTTMQNILGSTFGILTVTSHSQALEFPLIIISHLHAGVYYFKAHGQTIPNVGIYFPEHVFSHGQLYVALSRGVSRESTWVLAKRNMNIDSTGKIMKNIIYRDVLES